MRKKILYTFLLICIPYLLTADRITVLEENENELLIEFQLPEYTIKNVENKGVEYQKIVCDDATYLGQAGYPSLPYFTGIVGVPPEGNISVQIVNSESVTLKHMNILPAAYPIPKEDYLDYEIRENKEAYRSRGNFPEHVVTEQNIGYAGDRSVSSFKIYPFQYSAATQSLLVTKKMTLKVHIQGDKTRSRNWFTSSNYLDAIGDDFFLNNETSKYWRYEPEKIRNHMPRNNGEIEEIQFIVDEEGIYKVTKEHLLEMLALFEEEFFEEERADGELQFAWDWEQIDPRNLELSSNKGVVPLSFQGEEDGSFDDGDFFEFFADRNYGETSYYDEYTSENVYTLKLVDHLGARMAVKNGGLQFDDPSFYQAPVSYEQTVHFEEQQSAQTLGIQWEYYGAGYYREDRYFWDSIKSPDLRTYPFHLEYPEQTDRKTFSAKASLFGLTYSLNANDDLDTNILDHNAIVRVNTGFINQHQWNGQREQIFTNNEGIFNEKLQHGTNSFYVSLPGSYNESGNLITNEQILLDYFEVTYWREYKTSSDYIKFTKPSDKPNGLYQFTVQNFSNPDIFVYKIGTAVFENMQIEMDADNATYTLTMQDEVNSLTEEYIAVTEEQKKLPKRIRPNFPSRLKDTTNAAEYVVITIEDFIESPGAVKFKEVWENQGKQIELVSTQDIYDEFNHGIRSAHAIKDFISYVYHNWSHPRLTHVLLMGDGIDDERDNSPSRDFNLIPIRYIWAEQRGRIASDNWYACIVGDDIIPDISISRISIWEEDQLLDIAEKTEHYIQNPNFEQQWHGNAIMSAGGNPGEGSQFARQSERLKKRYLGKDFHVTRVYANTTGLPDNFSGTTSTLLQGINQGAMFVSFVGHGGGRVWADYDLLNLANVNSFNNENYPLFLSMSCFGGAFNGAKSTTIGEEVVLKAGKGGIGHIGFTGYGYVFADTLVFQYILDGIYNKRIGSLGQIADYTKTRFLIERGISGGSYNNVGVALTGGFALFGDNMINLLIPEIKHPVRLDEYHLSVGDTLTITADFPPDIEQAKFVIYDENDVQLPVNQYFPYTQPVVNGTLSVSDFVVPPGDAIRKNYVKVFANSDEEELLGITNFTIGKSAVANLELLPTFPTELDSILIQADFFDQQGVDSVFCEVSILDSLVKMEPTDEEHITFLLETPIGPRNAGTVISYRFHIHNGLGDVSESDWDSFMINGPDLMINNHEFTSHEMQPVFKVKIDNVGTMASLPCQLKLYEDNETILLHSMEIGALEVMESKYFNLPIQNVTGSKQFRIVVNENQESFSEIEYRHQDITTDYYDINVFLAGADAILVESLDGNLTTDFPEEMLPENHLFSINQVEVKEPLNQPDLEKVQFAGNVFSPVYEIKSFNETIFVDSMQTLPDEQKVILEFYYTDVKNSPQYYSVYRWFEPYQKWLFMGGEVDSLQNKVKLHSNKLGKFALFNNLDRTPPTVQVNVQGQEFSQENYSQNPDDDDSFSGGYVSRNGILSIILSDSNGIDVFTNEVIIEFGDNLVPKEEYTISLSLGHLTSVPIKYQLSNLANGDHVLTISCTDVNGNYKEPERIRLRVYEDFSIQNFANYPNPVRTKTQFQDNEGRTRFTYVLTEDADDVKIKIYTVSGRLVKTFHNLPNRVGYHEYPRTLKGWDCRDDEGFFLANGVYFYKIIAKKGSKTIEKMQKMAILK